MQLVDPYSPVSHTDPNSQPPQPDKFTSPPGLSPEEYRHGLLTGPPPGLVRVTAPVPAPIRVLGNQDVSLFGDFASHLDKNGRGLDAEGRRILIDLNCGICLDKRLCVPLGVTPQSHYDGNSQFESLEVLPCGHFFGSECLENWFYTSLEEGNRLRCPLCRYQLAYRCGHFLEPRTHHPEFYRADSVPLTIPEGGRVPEYCDSCHGKVVQETFIRLRDLLFPQVIAADLRHPESAGMLRGAEKELYDDVSLYYRMGYHYNMW